MADLIEDSMACVLIITDISLMALALTWAPIIWVLSTWVVIPAEARVVAMADSK